jgi:DNA-binding FrmR family transcriptional regulator
MKIALRIDLERLKGACTKILRKSESECTNLLTDLSAIQAAIDAGTVTVGVNVAHRKYKNQSGQDAVARTDWIRDRLS